MRSLHAIKNRDLEDLTPEELVRVCKYNTVAARMCGFPRGTRSWAKAARHFHKLMRENNGSETAAAK